MRKLLASRPFELRLGILLPVILIFGLWVNFKIAQASPALVEEFSPVVIHASTFADYSRDALDLSFPPIDPQIIEDIKKDQLSGEGDPEPAPAEATATPVQSSSPTPGLPVILPTLPPLLPTLPPLLPTLPPIVPTLLPIVPSLVPPIVQTVVPPVVPTVLAPIVTNLPCIPIPLLVVCH